MSSARVLIIEDHADTRELLQLILTRDGLQASGVGTLAEAKVAMQENCYDLYLMDSRLPDGSGFDFCRELRNNAPYKRVVFYSALAHEEEKQAGLDAGAIAYFVKPLELMELVKELKRLLAIEQEF